MSQVLGSLRRRGWRPGGRGARHLFASHPASKLATIPSSVDWGPRAPAIFDQGQLGSCYGHGKARMVTTAMEVLGHPLGFTMSPDDHYRLTRAMMRAAGELGPVGAPLTDAGSDPSKGAEAISIFGVKAMWRDRTPDGRVSDCDFDSVNEEPDLAELSADAHRVLTGEFAINELPGPSRVLALKRALSVAPCGTGFFCDMGFERWKAGDPPYGGPLDPFDPEGGGHFVTFDGYFDSGGKTTFIVANSWAEDWGDRGRILVSEDFVNDPQVSDLTAELLLKDAQ